MPLHHQRVDPMYDLNSLPLEALLNISRRSSLIDAYRTTEWVVIMDMGSRELVMNHDNARIFLQGLIYGATAAHKDERREVNGTGIDDVDSPTGMDDASRSGARRIVVE